MSKSVLPGPVAAGPKPKPRWYLDTEFEEDGVTIKLISIALVNRDGRKYYAVSKDYDQSKCKNKWVRDNVLTKLPPAGSPLYKTRATIRDEIEALLTEDGEDFLVWAYFADYDWVVFCQLWGTMMQLPKKLFPRFCMDMRQEMEVHGISRDDLPRMAEGTEHGALADAEWNLLAHDKCKQLIIERSRGRLSFHERRTRT